MAVTFVGIAYRARRSVSTRLCDCKGKITVSDWQFVASTSTSAYIAGMPKAASEGASAGQGGVVPSGGSGPVPISGKGSGQRREVPAGEEVRGQREVNQDATSGRDAELEQLRQQVHALQQAAVQNASVTQPVVQNLPAQQQSGQGKGLGQVRQGVIPNRDQSGLQSKTVGFGGNTPVLQSKSPPGLSVGGQGSSAARASELVDDGVQHQSRSPPGYSDRCG